ncbi:MAG: uridine kinase [Oscillospiraceae bacterium]|nr:uridine kinase [Oscillospiraceae bacterium]
MNSMIIGIAGGTGSGKTTLTEQIVRRFGDQVAVLCHDNYYHAHDDMPYSERCKLNYDHPDAFDSALMTDQLRRLKAGETIHCPTYDYTQHNRAAATVTVQPAPVIVVEGILILADPVLRQMMDIRIFVDTDADVRILRRILRDVEQRGRSLQSVVEQYLTTVKPMHEQFVEPSKRCADIIVLDGGRNLVALDMIMTRIAEHIAANS